MATAKNPSLSATRSNLHDRFDVAYFPLGAAAFGGAERSLLDLAKSQAQAGKRVLVGYESALEGTGFLERAAHPGVTLVRVDWAPERSLAEVTRAAVAFFRQYRADVVHFNISWRRRMWVVPVVARALNDGKLLGTMRAMPEPHALVARRRWLGIPLGLRVWTWADHLVGRAWARALHCTVSVNRSSYPPRLVDEYGFDPQRLKVIYNGVAIPQETPTDRQRSEDKTRLGFDQDDFLLAFVGRVSSEKGLRYLIEALPRMEPNVRLLVVGDGPERESLQASVAAAGLRDRVRFVGNMDDPEPAFRAADVVVVPSLWNEAFGRVVVEAMGCATPVIATRVGGMAELFDHERHGLYVEKADARALADAVGRVQSDPVLRSRLSKAGRDLALERYSTRSVVMQYSSLYASLGAIAK